MIALHETSEGIQPRATARTAARASFTAAALLALASMFAAHAAPAGTLDKVVSFDIKAKTLDEALLQFAAQAHVKISFAWNSSLAKLHAPELKGSYTAEHALAELLRGTRLYYVARDNTVEIVLRGSEPFRKSTGAPADSATVPIARESGAKRKPPALQEVIVTGTHIAGVEPVSPVVVITADDIQNSGLPDVASVIQALPQNYSGGQNPGAVVGGGINGGDTFFQPASANLRGLGSNATLTLLDGNRLAGSGTDAYVDLSSIPTAAVERVEIETGGDSAIYGADAVAGVVNVILRKNYDGERTDAYVGSTTDGGLTQRYSQLIGRELQGGAGGIMLGYQYQSSDAILASQRAVSQGAGDTTDLEPEERSQAMFLSSHYDPSAGVTARLEGVYNQRTSLDLWDGLENQDREDQFDLNGGLRFKVGHTGSIKVSTNWSGDSASGLDYQPLLNLDTPMDQQSLRNRLLEISVSGQGEVVELPGGRIVRLAAGVGVSHQTLDAGFPTHYEPSVSRGRRKDHAYMEINVPLVPAADGRLGLERLTLNAAGRFEHYDEFGSIAVPKFGISYVPLEDVDISGTWGRAYQPPTLYDLYGGETLIREPGSYFVGVPSGQSVLLLAGSNPDLRPETAVTRTVAIRWRPSEELLRGLSIGVSYYDIEFSAGINSPITNFVEAVSNPVFAPYVVQNPSAALQSAAAANAATNINPFGLPVDPQSVQALVFDTEQNVSREVVHGIDLSTAYLLETALGEWMVKGDASWESFDQTAIPGTAPVTIAGTIFNPPTFKARFEFGWMRRGWGASLFVNNVAGEEDVATVPTTEVPSWTTLDGQLRYRVRAVQLSLSVQNLLNKAPPGIPAKAAVIPPGIGFDADNYSAIGRFISLETAFTW